MPRSTGCVLLEMTDGWQLTSTGSGDVPSESVGASAADEIAESAAAFIKAHRLRRDRILIAPDSRSTVFTAFPTDDLAGARDRATMTFLLEGSLPFDAEQIVADFSVGEQQVIGLAVPCDDLLPIVTALEERGLLVMSIVPAAILACQSFARRFPQFRDGLILWQEDDRCELFRLADGRLVLWRHISGAAASVSRELAMLRLDSEDVPQATLVDVSDEVAEAARAACPDSRRITTDGLSELARQSAGHVLSGGRPPWFELRRGQLDGGDPYRPFRRSLTWLTTAAVLFVISLGAALWGRATQLQQQYSQVKQQQRELFKQTFPESSVPRAIVSRIESEHARMVASRRKTGEVPESQPALDVLHGFLAARPENLRIRTTEIRVENGDLVADIELRSHDDAGLVAAALEQAGFTVEPPTSTQRDEKTVVTRLRASWAPDEKNAAAQATLSDSGGSS